MPCLAGGTDETIEGNWQWITGEAWSYTNWNAGEPNGGTGENCIEYQDNEQWNDESCNSEREAYLVEYEPTPLDQVSVPTITLPGMMLMIGLLAVAGFVMLRRRE